MISTSPGHPCLIGYRQGRQVIGWLTTLIGTSRVQEILEGIRSGEGGPFEVSEAEACWLARQLLDAPSHRLSALLGVPERTIRHWRSDFLEDRRARRNDAIWEAYKRGRPVAEIAQEVGLSTRWVYEIVRNRRRGRRMAWHRLF